MRKSLFLIILLSCITYSQTLEERLQKFGEINGKGFVKPFVDAFGANLNSGLFHSADVSTGLDVYVGARFLFAVIPASAQEFDADMKELNDLRPYPLAPYPTPIKTATIFGKDGAIAVSGGAIPDSFKFPDGMNLKIVPFIVPQVSIGNVLATRAILRYFPYVKLGNWGEVSFLGGGVQHSIDQWLPALPFNWSAHVMYQTFKIKPVLEASAMSIGTEVSKTFVFATIYGGMAYEYSNMKFKYNWTPPIGSPKDIELKIDGINSFRFTAGLSLKWLIFNLNAEYNVAKQPVAVLGFGITI